MIYEVLVSILGFMVLLIPFRYVLVSYGSWCSHVKGYWSNKCGNILRMTYEEMTEVQSIHQSCFGGVP